MISSFLFSGAPSEQSKDARFHWSYEGLPPLVQAREELVREGKVPPRIGLFYDTSTLRYGAWNYHADLTTDYGRQWFYATVRDFFSMIPPKHWAMIDDRPIMLLYSASFVSKHDQSVIEFTRRESCRKCSAMVWARYFLTADGIQAGWGALPIGACGRPDRCGEKLQWLDDGDLAIAGLSVAGVA